MNVSECECEQVCKRTLTPAWNETLSLKLPPRAGVAGAELLVEAYDYDLVCTLTLRIHGSGSMDKGLGYRVYGLGFRV